MTTAAPPTPTKTGTRKLSEVAKYLVQPDGIRATGWPAVEKTCRTKLGIEFDEWQCGAGRLILSKTADGNLAVTVGGAHMSLPRQVGKTYLLMGLIFGLCVDNPGLLVIWSAHHARTHGETFLEMVGFTERSKVAPYIEQVFLGSGDEEIRFANGSRILFGARERGFGRGIPGVDILVMDEAQILSDRALENMLATLNTSKFGLQLYIGTPPTKADIEAGRAEYFMRTRAEALAIIEGGGEAPDDEPIDMVWIECGADDNAHPRDRKQWAKANPSYPHRTPETSILRLAKKLKAEGFLREGLGIWPSDEDTEVINLRQWSTDPVLDRKAEAPSRVALVIATSLDRRKACIGVAGEYDGRTLVMSLTLPIAKVADKVAELKNDQDIIEVALAGAPPKGLKPRLSKLDIEFEQLAETEMGAACAAFIEGVRDHDVVHVGQDELDSAVAKAKTRMVGKSEQWTADCEPPLVACSGAYYRWGLLSDPNYDPLESIL